MPRAPKGYNVQGTAIHNALFSRNQLPMETMEIANNPFFSQSNSMNMLSSMPDALLSGIGFAQNINREADSYDNMRFTDPSVMQGGVPTYAGVSQARQEYGAIDAGEAGKGLVGKGALTGGKAGLSAGSSFGPLGAGIGLVAGGTLGAIGGAFGQKKVRREAEEAQAEGRENFLEGQKQYNIGVDQYFDKVDQQRQEIQEDREYMNRVFGIGNQHNPFASII